MSTRYVWGKYEIEVGTTIKYSKNKSYHYLMRYDDYGEPAQPGDTLYYARGKTIEALKNSTYPGGYAKFTGTYETGSVLIEAADEFYYIPLEAEDYVLVATQPVTEGSLNSTTLAWLYARENLSLPCYYDSQTDDCSINYSSMENAVGIYTENVDEKGSLTGYASSASAGAYPQDGISGSYWYDYQGSDNIDPSACTIPATINGGTQITIKVTPGTGKIYSGNVSYQYQVNLGGAGWTTLTTTSATSYKYTVPYGTSTIQVRVRAQDNLGFTSSTYVTSSSVTVINNQPPTAPGSIAVSNVVAGQTATITLTAATDPDGTIASYIYERSVDGSAWQQIANVNSLTYQDTVSGDWGTVAYRACAVDDDGESGPYVTSETTTVNSGWVIISGPAADMGSQPKPFDFTITPSISGTTTSAEITVDITLDGQSIYSDGVVSNTAISLNIDTRVMRTGSHSLAVSASCADYVPTSSEYMFSIPEIAVPDGGRLEQLEAADGQVVFPITLARAVAGLENYGVESQVHPGSYTGSGTYGSGNPNSLVLEFEPKLVIIQGTSGRMAVMIKPSGIGVSIGSDTSTTLTVTWNGKTVSWYNGISAINQMNTNGETYSYTAFG